MKKNEKGKKLKLKKSYNKNFEKTNYGQKSQFVARYISSYLLGLNIFHCRSFSEFVGMLSRRDLGQFSVRSLATTKLSLVIIVSIATSSKKLRPLTIFNDNK